MWTRIHLCRMSIYATEILRHSSYQVVLIMRRVCLGAEKQLSNSKMCGIHMITQAGCGKKVYDSTCTY